MPNDGEILSLPLFSSEYRVEQSEEIDNAKFQSSTKAPPTTITVAPVIRTDIVSIEDVSSNLNVAADDDDDDDIDNTKSPLIGDLDGIVDEYYQAKGNNKKNEANIGYDGVPDDNDNYGVIYDRNDDDNPPSLPPESNMPCIHSTNIPSDEVNTLIDKVYRVEQSDEVNTLIDKVNEEYPFWRPRRDKEYSDEEEHNEDSIEVLDGTRQDILNSESNVESENYDDESKEKIALPSLVSQVVKDDAVMKNEEVILSLNVAPVDDSNLNVVSDAEDDADNAKLQFECKNSIGDLDGIRDEYYQVKQNYDDLPKAIASPGIWDDVDSIVQDYDEDEENNSFIIEEECSIVLYPVNLIIHLHFLTVHCQ